MNSIDAIKTKLVDAGVVFVRLLWCDNANLIRAKAAHVNLLKDGFDGVGISAAQQALPVMYDAVAQDSGLGPVGDALLQPDWSTLQILPYAPGHAAVIGNMMWNNAPWEHCPRAYLRQQLAQLAATGYSLQAAFENEFFLLQKTETGYVPADQTTYAATSAMNQQRAFVLELSNALEVQGLSPEFYYPESAPGQLELGISYSDALSAADKQLIFRETARGLAQQHGYSACFLPKVIDNAAGSGCHINLSLWQEQRNVMADETHSSGLSQVGRHFMAGVLAHLPGLCALSIPTPNSYRRIKPQFWAGAYRSWGYANREAALRVTRGRRGANRFELKAADASANPYLALGALIAAGMDGIHKALELPPESTVDPELLSDQERQDMGIDLLPQTLAAALDALQQDDVLLRSLGSARARAYIAVKQTEWEALKDMSLADEVALLAERY